MSLPGKSNVPFQLMLISYLNTTDGFLVTIHFKYHLPLVFTGGVTSTTHVTINECQVDCLDGGSWWRSQLSLLSNTSTA